MTNRPLRIAVIYCTLRFTSHGWVMPELTGMLLIVVVLALVFDFSNGWHDSANATTMSSIPVRSGILDS